MSAVDLYWLPLGAGGHVVRLNGKVYERLVSLAERRPPLDLYHSALVVRLAVIPDLAEAVQSPVRLSEDEGRARRILEVAPGMPAPVWGRDELRAGEMWNSNSIISWLPASAGFDMPAIRLPAHGRAPGWDAGLVVARRQGVPR